MFIAVAAIRRAVADDVEIVVAPSLIGVGITAAVNLGVAVYSRRAARISGSVAIASDARHLVTNVVQAVAVERRAWCWWASPAATSSTRSWRCCWPRTCCGRRWASCERRCSELIDSALPEETLRVIEECLAHEEHGMRGYHELRTRKSGRETYIDVHVLVDPALTVSEAHLLVEHFEHDMRGACPARS